jgi:chromate transport protein ChrA
MMAGRLLEIAVGFVLPTAAVIWGLWILWRSFRPGDVKMPSPVIDGIVGFLLICVFIVLVVLAWELFRTWRYPRGAFAPRPTSAASARPAELGAFQRLRSA